MMSDYVLDKEQEKNEALDLSFREQKALDKYFATKVAELEKNKTWSEKTMNWIIWG